MSRPRDAQRQRLYNAENKAFKDGLGGVKHGRGRLSLAECQTFIASVQTADWFVEAFGDEFSVSVKAPHGPQRRALSWGGVAGFISLPVWGRSEWVVLHELAHNVNSLKSELSRWDHGPAFASHGPEFAAVYLTLVEHALGSEAHDALRAEFLAGGVRFEGMPAKVAPPVADDLAARRSAAALKAWETRRRNADITRGYTPAAADVLARLRYTAEERRELALAALAAPSTWTVDLETGGFRKVGVE